MATTITNTTTMTTMATKHTPSAPLPVPFNKSASKMTPIIQGAEAVLYQTLFLTENNYVALKVRPRKSYRHPILDARLTKQRLISEARVLVRCRREGVAVPAVVAMDWDDGWLALEWIQGRTVRQCLDVVLKHREDQCDHNAPEDGEDALLSLMQRVGRTVGKMHDSGVVHGDLTTSNLMVRDQHMPAIQHAESTPETTLSPEENIKGEIVIIDFGLAVQTVQDEDRAVDLYVLERAFGSTHPQAEELFQEVLRVYGESFKGAKTVLRRLNDVRLRGRKKSMLG